MTSNRFFITYHETDGTSNDALLQLPDEEEDQTFTNVLKLHILGGGAIDPKVKDQAMRNKEGGGQISLYEVGCGSKEDMDTKPITSVNQLLGDLNKQIDPMMEQLSAEYEEGDKLFVFGFSRGAASARKFACQLDENGLQVGNKVVDSPGIALLGCFDTVAMQLKANFTGIIRDWWNEELPSCTAIGEEHFKVAENVVRAVHLLSLDDNRQFNQGTYPPTLMGMDIRVDELWMPGVHSDVGGWWYKDNGITDIALEYMMKEGKKAGLEFLEAKDVDTKAVTIATNDGLYVMEDPKTPLEIHPAGTQKNHQSKRNRRRPSPRPIYVAKNDAKFDGAKPRIHVSAVDHVLDQEGPDEVIFNPFFEDLDFDVVDNEGNILGDKTSAMKTFVADQLANQSRWEKWRT